MDSNAPDSVGTDGLSAVERATQMRASLGARRDVESMLAEAAQLRQQAAADADATVEEAQQISEALVAESKQQAGVLTAEAHERAEGILAQARQEADEHRAQVRAEVAEQSRRELAQARQQSQSLVQQAEDAVRGLGGNLDQASARIAAVLQTLGELRTSAVDPDPTDDLARATAADDRASYAASAPAVPAVAAQAPAFEVSQPDQEPAEVPEPSIASFMDADTTSTPEPSVASFAEVPRAEVPEAVSGFTPFSAFAQAGEEERLATREVPAVPAARLETEHTSIFAAARDELEVDLVKASHAAEDDVVAAPVEHRSELGADLRDREAEETLQVVPDAEQRREPRDEQRDEQKDLDPEPASRPLGWLFRSAQ